MPSQPPVGVAKPAPAPVGAAPDDSQGALNDFLQKQYGGLEKYGPEQQMAVQNALIKARTGLGPSLARAGGTFADALIQGVAGAGPSHIAENITDKQNKLAEEQMGTMEKAQTGKMAQQQAQMKLLQDDPNSSLSKIAQKAYGATLKTMPGGENLSDKDIAKIPASMIAAISTGKIELSKALAEIENTEAYREATLGIQKATLEQTKAHETAEENLTGTGQALAHPVAGFLAKHGIIQAPAAGTNQATGPLGSETVRDGKTYVWSAQTGKYHLKQ
jgi:hypothetical protein